MAEKFVKRLETEYPRISAEDAAKIREIAAGLPAGKAEWVEIANAGVGPATNLLQVSKERVSSWSDWVGVDPRIPPENGGWQDA